MSRNGFLKDDELIRGNIPMTKEEVRNLSIIKLGLQKDSVLYDVGAGTGSISVVASLTSNCKVYAFEKKEEGVDLIKQNACKFNLDNQIMVTLGMAPESFQNIEAPTHVFIGGSTGRMFDIIKACIEKARDENTCKELNFVINAISLETIGELNEIPVFFEKEKLEGKLDGVIEDFELVQVGVTRAKAMGGYHMMMGENPVMICSFKVCYEC